MFQSNRYSMENFWCSDDKIFISHVEKIWELFNDNIVEINASQKSSIPRILHFIWIGSLMPPKFLSMIESWRIHHSHWEIKVWNDEAIKSLSISCQYEYDWAPNFGMKSDILRYEVFKISRYGAFLMKNIIDIEKSRR